MSNKREDYEYQSVKTSNGFYKIVNSQGIAITDKEYLAVETFNYQRHDDHIVDEVLHNIKYPTAAPIDYIFAVKEVANWDALKGYNRIELDGVLNFVFNIFSLLHFWIKVKRKKVERWKYVTKTGEIITNAIYEDPYPFISGVCIVKVNKKWGVIDNEGKEIIPVIYDKVEFIFNFSEFGEKSSLAYFKVTVGKSSQLPNHFETSQNTYGLYSLKGEILIKPIYKNLHSINWRAVEIIRGERLGSLTERGEENKMQLISLRERITRLPRKHFFVSFDNANRESNFLFYQPINGFQKIPFAQQSTTYIGGKLSTLNLYDFDFMTVSYKTGTITMTCKGFYYEIASDGELNTYEGYPNY